MFSYFFLVVIFFSLYFGVMDISGRFLLRSKGKQGCRAKAKPRESSVGHVSKVLLFH